MSSKMDFSGSLKRALKFDVDPVNMFGLNPSKKEHKEMAAARARRASQIEFEASHGGSVDPPTKQKKKLKSRTILRPGGILGLLR